MNRDTGNEKRNLIRIGASTALIAFLLLCVLESLSWVPFLSAQESGPSLTLSADESADDLLTDDGADDLLTDEPGGDLLTDDTADDLLTDEAPKDLLADDPAEEVGTEEDGLDVIVEDAQAAHENLFAESRYPSAATCATCHPKQYEEWAVSQHSYAQLSPVYVALSNKINVLSSGSNGDFCLRCHSQVGANLGESPYLSNLDRHPTAREGITCVVCHRINKSYNKASGRIPLVEGGITATVFGPDGNDELKRVLDDPDYFVVADPKKQGRKIHGEAKQFTNISSSMFCGGCHDVTLLNGFRLEEAFSEYRLSPAAANGVSCQDCHMGKVQGKVSGYEEGPAAIVGGIPTKKRKLSSHLFSGPDYSVVHPGIFPHNTAAQELATLKEWLTFDYKAGWGSDEFEDNVPESAKFPDRWSTADDRYDAREILNEQFKRLDFAKEKRMEVLRNGYHLGEIETLESDEDEIRFKVNVKNLTDGHNVPTGFTGERLVWLYVKVTDKAGKVIFESGDLDPNGDVRDHESSYVHNGELPLDGQLFDLRSRFLVGNLRGGERERIIPIPYPVITIPFVRPSINSLIFTGEPATERAQRRGIEPLGERWPTYTVSDDELNGNGPYEATVQLKANMAPVNLIGAIQSVGFDYGLTPRQVGDTLRAGIEILWEKKVTFNTSS